MRFRAGWCIIQSDNSQWEVSYAGDSQERVVGQRPDGFPCLFGFRRVLHVEGRGRRLERGLQLAPGGGGISTRVPGVDTTDDSVVLGDQDATIHFPTSVDETKYIGSFYINGVSPAADLSTTRTITLDTRDTSFYYTNAVAGVHPIVKGYTYEAIAKLGVSRSE